MEDDGIFIILAETLPHIVWRTQPNGDVDYFNQHWYEYTGLSPDQSLNDGWINALHPNDHDRVLSAWKQALKEGTLPEQEYRLRSKDKLYHWFLVRASPAYDKHERILWWFGTCTDINDRKMAEQALLHREQELTKLNITLDSFVRIAAHDLNSPLNNMQTLLELCRQTAGGKTPQEQIIIKLEQSVNRMQETLGSIEALLRWQEEGKAEPLQMQFSEILQRVKDMIFHLLEQNKVTIDTDFSQAEQIYYIEPYLISIMKNLITNAIKYRSPHRDCVISVKTEKLKDGVLMTVSDNSIGIDLDKYRDQLFQSFKRFSSQAAGIGLGLYLIRQMTEHNGGKVEVESQLDKGTTFKLHLVEYEGGDKV